MDAIRYPLIKETFLSSVIEEQRNGKPYIYFIDAYVGNPIELTESQWNTLKNADPTTEAGKISINEFAEMYNEEHVIPAGIYGRREPIVNDLHNIIPVITIINDKRSNLDIRNIPENATEIETLCYNPKVKLVTPAKYPSPNCVSIYTPVPLDIWYNKKSPKYPGEYKTVSCLYGNCYFQPAQTEYRGLIARTVLYFHSTYASNLFDGGSSIYSKYMTEPTLQLMKEWNDMYPPTEFEKRRHQKIFEKTGKINSYTLNYRNITGGQQQLEGHCHIL